ncbi:hypothetical protein H7H73_06860, partial [Mycobacterium rufum]|nr:hypothetical protein [Mycolicibacterium rufum]
EPEPAPDDTPDTEDDRDGGAHTGGQSVAELLARLQATPSGAAPTTPRGLIPALVRLSPAVRYLRCGTGTNPS